MGKIISIQLANTTSGEYDVLLPLPYPFHISEDGSVGRQEFWKGDPSHVIGFQRRPVVGQVDILWESAAEDPDQIVGLYPVFACSDGRLFSQTLPVRSAAVSEDDEVSA